jgi:hypothetical protein
MNTRDSGPDREFEAIRAIYAALDPLDENARARVMNYIRSRFDLAPKTAVEGATNEESTGRDSAENRGFSTFAELFDAAHHPQGASNKALLAGYWLQVCQGQSDFDGQSANKELKNLGEGITNITIAMNSLKDQRPALAIQLRKSGKSQQARKTYKITIAGITAVETMING